MHVNKQFKCLNSKTLSKFCLVTGTVSIRLRPRLARAAFLVVLGVPPRLPGPGFKPECCNQESARAGH